MSAGRHDSEYLGGGGGMAGAQSDFSQHGGREERGQGQVQPRYKFSPEEMRVLRECNRESFYYRSMPLGTMMSLGVYYAVRQGYLRPSPRFGPGPKMFAAAITGYFVGKFSYQKRCVEKIMALPNSHLAEMLKKKKGQMGFQESLSLEPSFATAAPVGGPAFPNSDFSQQPRGHVYSDVGDTRPMSSFDSEGVSSLSGYDYSPNHSSPSSTYDTTQQMLDDENLPPKRPQFFTSYDDLRRQNRVDYENKQHRTTIVTPAPPPSPDSQGSGYDGSQNRRNSVQEKSKNIYGDIWDDKPASY